MYDSSALGDLQTFAIWALWAQPTQVLLIYFFIPISESAVYGTNDDALIASISNGQLTGENIGYLIFLNPLISFPIAWLRRIIPNANFYVYFLTFVITLLLSVILGLNQFELLQLEIDNTQRFWQKILDKCLHRSVLML